MNYRSSNDLTYEKRCKIVEGYSRWVSQQLEAGYIGYYVNFMFNKLPGGTKAHIEIMKREVAAVHGKLTLRVVRKPKSEVWQPLRPRFIGCPDFPVRKSQRKKIPLEIVNDGLHFNGLFFVPPRRRGSGGKCVANANDRRSRLTTGLIAHFKNLKRNYCTRFLESIHLARVFDRNVCDYAFKAFKAGKIHNDDILVL